MRKFTIAGSAVLLAVALTACGGPSGAGGGGSDGSDTSPIVIGFVAPSNGSLAEVGKQAQSGWELAVEEVNAAGGVDGREVKLVSMESDGQAANTVRSVRQAVTQEGANFIGGVTTSPEVSAVNQQLASLNVLSFSATAQDDALTGEACVANSFQTTPSVSMLLGAIDESLAELKGDKWAIMVPDYSTGHTVAASFTEAVEAAGKEVVMTEFPAQGTTDFSPYITKMMESGADALFVNAQGADGVAFVKQADQFNAFDSLETVLGFNTFYRFSLPAMGDEVEGFFANLPYNSSADNELNKNFVKAYEEKYGETPDYVQAFNYLAAQTLFEGVRQAGSVDTDEVQEALNGMTYDSIAGEVTMRAADHQLLMPSSIGKITKDGDELGFEVLLTSGSDAIPAPNPACKL